MAGTVWDLYWDAHHRWWTRDERGGTMDPTGPPMELPVPQYPRRSVMVRPGTTDVLVYYDCLIDRQYTRALSRRQAVRTIVDAGANVGMATVAFLIACPNARLLAIEPDSSNAMMLRENVRAFGDVVEVLEGAIVATHTPIALAARDRGTWAAHVEDAPVGLLRTITPNECVLRFAPELDVFKIDIEGAEIALFNAADLTWLSRTRLLLVEPENAGSAVLVEHVTRRSNMNRTYAYRDVIGYARVS
jgi:FkbM family methyltransferase